MKRAMAAAGIVVLSAIFLAGCGKGVRVTEYGPANAGSSIMIASYPSEYKDRITQGLVERYKGRSKIALVPLGKLNSIDHRRYDVLVILDALHAWQLFNPTTRWFVGKIKDPADIEKVVLFFTAGKPSERYTFMGIDAITAASEVQDDAGSVAKIAAKIDEVLKRGGKKP